jgi:hypothetical protein
MNWLNGSDASDPTEALPGQVACGYIGGDTPHPWTFGQWEMQTAEFLLPIYTANPKLHPVNESSRCVDALVALKVHEDTAFMLDSELFNGRDNGWIDAFCRETSADHYGCHVYASASNIFTLPPRSGYIVADWTEIRHMYEHPFVKGTQWSSDATIDRDVFDSTMKFWRNPYVIQ